MESLWILCALLHLIVAVFSAPLSDELDKPQRVSTPEILDLEQQLKKQAGEDKKLMPKVSDPLPQIDGLADDDTKQQQAAALASMIKQQAPDAAATQEAADVLALPEESSGEVAHVPVKVDEADEEELALQNLDESEADLADGAEDPEAEVPVNTGSNYDDMFYDRLIQSVKSNPAGWAKLVKEQQRILDEEKAYEQQLRAEEAQRQAYKAYIESPEYQQILAQKQLEQQPWEYTKSVYTPEEDDEAKQIPQEDWQYYVGDSLAREVAKKRGYGPMSDEARESDERQHRSFVMM